MRVKKLAISLIILVLIMVISIPVLAVNDYDVTLEIGKTQVDKGETVEVTVSLTNINLSTGLGTFQGKLTYDETVFETVEQADIVGATDWGTVVYNPNGGYMIVERSAGDVINTDNEVMTITLKVKSDATSKNAQITISEISCSTGEEDLEALDVTAQVNVVQQIVDDVENNTVSNNVVNNGVTNNSVSNNVTNNTVNNVINNKVSNNTVNKVQNDKVENVPATSLPHAGASQYIMPVIIIAVLAGGISYIHYKKIKDIK